MSEALSSSFERLLGKKASDEEVRRLYEVKEALKLDDNDALWIVLFALEHYDALYRGYPALIAEEARRTLEEVRGGFADAAKLEARRASRKLADAVADAALKIAAKRSDVARLQGFAAAGAVMVTFGSLCLSVGYALGSARIPPWTQSRGARRLIGAALGAPAGWMLLLLLLPLAAYSARLGWTEAHAGGATPREVLVGWGRVVLAISGAAALTTLVVRVL